MKLSFLLFIVLLSGCANMCCQSKCERSQELLLAKYYHSYDNVPTPEEREVRIEKAQQHRSQIWDLMAKQMANVVKDIKSLYDIPDNRSRYKYTDVKTYNEPFDHEHAQLTREE